MSRSTAFVNTADGIGTRSKERYRDTGSGSTGRYRIPADTSDTASIHVWRNWPTDVVGTVVWNGAMKLPLTNWPELELEAK